MHIYAGSTMNSVQCTPCTVYWYALYVLQCTMYSVRCPCPHKAYLFVGVHGFPVPQVHQGVP